MNIMFRKNEGFIKCNKIQSERRDFGKLSIRPRLFPVSIFWKSGSEPSQENSNYFYPVDTTWQA